MARKGDIVALEITRTTHFVNPFRSEERKEWTLVKVWAADHAGNVKSIVQAGYASATKLRHMAYKPRIHTIETEQARAAKVMAADPLAVWASAEELKAAILGA